MLHDNLEIRNGELYFAGRNTVELCEKYGTPLILIDENKIRERARFFATAMTKYFTKNSKALFASKALCFKRLYQIISEEGMATDIVSIGELLTAKNASFNLANAYFHGNNKTRQAVETAIENGVGYFIVDNVIELDKIDDVCKQKGVKQKVLLRLSPGIDPHTHAKVVTGSVDSKFGVAIETGQAKELVKYALSKENIILEGFHAHIGSQIFDEEPFVDSANIMASFCVEMKKAFNFTAKTLNLGGGFGVRYVEEDPSICYDELLKNISVKVKKKFADNNYPMPDILIEPGRSTVADSGMTLYTTEGVKTITGYKSYISIDGGMTDNPRYALYQSKYTVLNASKADKPCDFVATIAGCCCESGDLIQENVKIAKPDSGDKIAVLVTGAYNYSMSSNYNKVPRPPIVMIKDEKDYVAVRRETYDDLQKCDL